MVPCQVTGQPREWSQSQHLLFRGTYSALLLASGFSTLLSTQEGGQQQEGGVQGPEGEREKEEKSRTTYHSSSRPRSTSNHVYCLPCWGLAPNTSVHIYTPICSHHLICSWCQLGLELNVSEETDTTRVKRHLCVKKPSA